MTHTLVDVGGSGIEVDSPLLAVSVLLYRGELLSLVRRNVPEMDVFRVLESLLVVKSQNFKRGDEIDLRFRTVILYLDIYCYSVVVVLYSTVQLDIFVLLVQFILSLLLVYHLQKLILVLLGLQPL